MSSNTSASPPPVEKVEVPASKSINTKAKKAPVKKVASKGAAAAKGAHPSWKDIIKECIAANKADSRTGVSRSTIKKFAEEQYKLDVSGTNLYQLNRAITTGAEQGVFALPKGPSGKVKLAPKTKITAVDSGKENPKPTSSKKVAEPVKKATKKKSTSAKSAIRVATTKKPAVEKKKIAAPSRKADSAAKKKLAGASAKKPVAKSTSTTKKTSTAKAVEKKAAAKAAATKIKAKAKAAPVAKTSKPASTKAKPASTSTRSRPASRTRKAAA